jgi:hypothetical protein
MKTQGFKTRLGDLTYIKSQDGKPVKMESGEVIINKKSTKKNIEKLVEINNDSTVKSSKKVSNDGTKGGLLKGKPHYDKNGKPIGGIKVIVDNSKEIEVEGDEFVVNKEASKKHWKELSKINQSAGGGVPIAPPSGAFDDDPEDNYEHGGKIDFNPNHIPSKRIVNYAKQIKAKHPEIWKLGGNIFGNEAFENLERVSKRGYWLDSEEWMYIKWRAYVARHQRDYRIEGVVAMLKWCDNVEKGWAYMKDLIEEKIKKNQARGWKHNMKDGGRTISQTPAPLKDRIKGSKFNEKGSASSSSKASDIKFDTKTLSSIQNLIDEHNENHPSKKITLSVAKAVVRRGMGAYSSSHRPTISGGKPNSRTAWGLARLKAFIYKAQTGKSKSGNYSQDNDLFEELGISVQKMSKGGVVEFNKMIESEYLKTYKEDYDSIEKINSIVATQYLQQIAIKNGFPVGEVEFVNESKNPKNHFQMTMHTYDVEKNQDVIIYTAPFVYVDDKHKVVQSKTKVELLNSDWETIKKDIRYKDGGSVDSNVELVSVDYLDSIRTQDKSPWNYDLEKSIEEKGVEEPVVIGFWAEYGYVALLDGHHRLDTAIELGIDKIPAIVIDKYDEPHGKVKLYRTPMYKENPKKPSDLGIYKDGGSVDAKDTVTLDIPLLIRTLELAREDIKSDAELHKMVERLLDLKNKPELTMDDYAYIADIEHKHLKPKMELGGNIEIEKLIAKAHDNITRKRGRKEYAPTSHELQEEIDRMIMEDQFGSNNI